MAHPAQERADLQPWASRRSVGDVSPIPGRCMRFPPLPRAGPLLSFPLTFQAIANMDQGGVD
eukprot:5369963-Pyramimonas_sp.AAC.1